MDTLTLNITIEKTDKGYAIRSRAFKDNKPMYEDDTGRIYTRVTNKELAIQLCKEAVISHNASNSPFKTVFRSPKETV